MFNCESRYKAAASWKWKYDWWLKLTQSSINKQLLHLYTSKKKEILFSWHLPYLAIFPAFFLITSPCYQCSNRIFLAGNPGTRPSHRWIRAQAPHSPRVAVSPPVPYAACVLTASGQWRSEPGAKNEACRLIDQILIPHDLQQSQPTKTSFILMWHGPRVGSLKFTGQ